MGNGPSDDDVRRAQIAAQKQKETADALGGYVSANRLDVAMLQQVLDKFAPGNDAVEDGVYAQSWMATDTFYRFTSDYVSPEKQTAYRVALEHAFPGKKHGR